jgi:aspartate kinase
VIVAKFGGTSVADAAALGRLVEIVARLRDGGPGPVVVVSALAGVTDGLLAAADAAAAGDLARIKRTLQELEERHRAAAAVLPEGEARERATAELARELGSVDATLSALAVLREVSPRSRDAVAASGELLSSRLVAAALQAACLPAAWADARRAIVTDACHGGATPFLGESAEALGRELGEALLAGAVPVLGGYVGATAEGVTTTLGRGGSDYSAAVVGACLGAREIQIWADFDGLLRADPRLVEAPRLVPQLSFAEAAELAYFGAKVLHPSTIRPAMERGIPVRILNSRRPLGPGTLITAERADDSLPLTAVASKRNVTVVDITSTRMLMAHGFLSRLFEAFERERTAVDVVTTSEVSVSVTVDDPARVPQIARALEEFAEVSCEDGMAIVCVVGERLKSDPRLVARVLDALDGVPLRMLSQASSRRNLTFVVRDADLAPALRRIHERFFAAEPQSVAVLA